MDQFDFLRGVNAGDRHLEQAMMDAQRDRQYEQQEEDRASRRGPGRVWEFLRRLLSL
jgi:hypothetical protein